MSLSAEDRFAVVDMVPLDRTLPGPNYFGTLGLAAQQLGESWQFLWDFRGTGSFVFNDVVDAYEEAHAWREVTPVVLAEPDAKEDIEAELGTRPHKVIGMRQKVLPFSPFDLAAFEELEMLVEVPELDPDVFNRDGYYEAAEDFGMLSGSGEELVEDDGLDWDDSWMESLDVELSHDAVMRDRTAYLDKFLRQIASNSLLTTVNIEMAGDAISVVPYHAHSLHHVATPDDDLVLVRPARPSRRYWTSFRREILKLEALLNRPATSEREIEELLMSNPLFLRGLNYQSVYGQVVLPRPDGTSLRPDIIAEPIDSQWAHIIELKLPSERILVGRPNRARLAWTITEVTAQLREYAAYFDNRDLAKTVQHQYGFKCHKPKLVAIIGRDPRGYSEEETRRAITSQPDLEILSWDQLLKAARSMPLI